MDNLKKYFKIINQSVPAALRKIGYSEAKIEEIVSYAVGHVSTINNMWYNNYHYLHGTCGPRCNCRIALATNLPGCWECKTHVRMKRVSTQLNLIADYRTIRTDLY